MIKEFNPIDKKSLIIYSLILVVVIVVSAIVIKVPAKKTVVTPTPTPPKSLIGVGPGTTEVSGYQIKGGWLDYKGASFDINYPAGFTSKVSADTVIFSSTDGLTKLAVYSPVTPGQTPAEFIVNDATENLVDTSSGKNPTCNALICSRKISIIVAKDKSYSKKIIVSKNNADKTTTAFSFQYLPSTPDSEVSDVFNYFQQSLARHAQ